MAEKISRQTDNDASSTKDVISEKDQISGKAPISGEAPPDEGEAQTSGCLVEISCSMPRRRAGLNFGPVATVVDVSTLDRHQLSALEDDPLLVIRRHVQAEQDQGAAVD